MVVAQSIEDTIMFLENCINFFFFNRDETQIPVRQSRLSIKHSQNRLCTYPSSKHNE